MAGADQMAKCWDIPSNHCIQVLQLLSYYISQRIIILLIKVAAHDAPIKTCHWISSPNYSCLMTGSLDKTVPVLLLISLMKLILNPRKMHIGQALGSSCPATDCYSPTTRRGLLC